MLTYWHLGARNLIQARQRTTLLAAALGTVSMFMVLLMTLSQGIGETMIGSATLLITGHLNVGGFYKSRPGNAAMVVSPTSEIRRLVQQTLPNIDSMVDRSRSWGKVVSSEGVLEALLSGIDVDQEPRLLRFLQLAPERDYIKGGSDSCSGDLRGLRAPHTAMLFAAQAKRLNVKVGDMLTVSTQTLGGQQNTDEVRVVAIVRDAGYLSNRNVFVDKQSLRNLLALNEDASGLVMVYLTDIKATPQASKILRRRLTDSGYQVMPHVSDTWRKKLETAKSEDWTGQRLDITEWQDELGNAMWILNTLNSLTVLFVGLLALIVVAGIINTMWIAVRERTQEVGMLRAIGMSRVQVLKMFLAEACLLGLVATGLGSLFGALVALGVDSAGFHVPIEAVQAVLLSDVVRLVVQPHHIAKTVGLFTLCTTFASLWPALRATRLQPLTAIQKVG